MQIIHQRSQFLVAQATLASNESLLAFGSEVFVFHIKDSEPLCLSVFILLGGSTIDASHYSLLLSKTDDIVVCPPCYQMDFGLRFCAQHGRSLWTWCQNLRNLVPIALAHPTVSFPALEEATL